MWLSHLQQSPCLHGPHIDLECVMWPGTHDLATGVKGQTGELYRPRWCKCPKVPISTSDAAFNTHTHAKLLQPYVHLMKLKVCLLIYIQGDQHHSNSCIHCTPVLYDNGLCILKQGSKSLCPKGCPKGHPKEHCRQHYNASITNSKRSGESSYLTATVPAYHFLCWRGIISSCELQAAAGRHGSVNWWFPGSPG